MGSGHHITAVKVRGRSLRNFCYLIVDEATRQAAAVDPAWEPELLAARLEELGATLSAVLLTHSHFDHVNGVEPLLARYPEARAYMSAREVEGYGFRCRRLTTLARGDAVRVGGTEIACLATPGHTAGGSCYLLADALFTGDTIFTEGCGICTAPGSSPDEMFESVSMIKRLVDPEVRVFPGHSFGAEPGQRLRSLLTDNIYFQLGDREEFVAWRMRPVTAEFETR
jgi:glyoxylase-like metal-dependent hydrolase (beta-lactamase superfamily II)